MKLFLPAVLLGTVLLFTDPGPMAGQQITYRQFGTPAYDAVEGVSATAEGVYVVGSTGGALPGQTNAGSGDVFVRKYDLGGNELWTRQFGTSASDVGNAISATGGVVYILGLTGLPLPGQTSGGVFLRKYDANGNELWTRPLGLSVQAVSATPEGVFLTGTVDNNAFLQRCDANGNELWTRTFGMPSQLAVARGEGVSTVGDGIYVAAATFLYPRTYGGFVSKFNFNGDELWRQAFGHGPAVRFVTGVSATVEGAYVVGDDYLGKHDPAGTKLWTRLDSTASWGQPSATEDGVYVAGAESTEKRAGFDAIVRRYDPAGREVWNVRFGTHTSSESVSSVSVTARRVYAGGTSDGALPGQTSAGGNDAFLAIITEP